VSTALSMAAASVAGARMPICIAALEALAAAGHADMIIVSIKAQLAPEQERQRQAAALVGQETL
jgi:hypothetical protein